MCFHLQYLYTVHGSYRHDMISFLPCLQRVKGTTVVCSEILKKAGLSGWRMGQSRVFLRYYHEEKLQLLLKKLDDKALILQRVYRGHLARKW